MFPETFISNLAQVYILPIIDRQGFRTLSSQEQEKILEPLIEGAIVRIVSKVSSELSEQARSIFKTLTAQPDQVSVEVWQQFWLEHLPGYEQVVQETVLSYQEELRAAFVS